MGVSFQMSFSAVLALISGYEVLRPVLARLRGDHSGWRRFAHHVAGLALTSAFAGTASAPFAAYHFGRIQIYFVLANMIAVPLTATVVMPLGLLALALMPFHLEWLVLVPMGWGVQAVLWIGRAVAALPQAVIAVPAMPLVEPGRVRRRGRRWLGIWRTRIRLLGFAMLAAGMASPLLAEPPDMLVSADARLIAWHHGPALFVQSAKGASAFTRDAWEQIVGGARHPPDADRRRGLHGAGLHAACARPVRAAAARCASAGRLRRGARRFRRAHPHALPAAHPLRRSLLRLAQRRPRHLAGAGRGARALGTATCAATAPGCRRRPCRGDDVTPVIAPARTSGRHGKQTFGVNFRNAQGADAARLAGVAESLICARLDEQPYVCLYTDRHPGR